MKELTADETPAEMQTHTISGVTVALWNDPGRFVKYWNYKGAVLSGVIRAPIFFATYLIGKETLRFHQAAVVLFGSFLRCRRNAYSGCVMLNRHGNTAAILLLVPLISTSLNFLCRRFAYVTDTQNLTDTAYCVPSQFRSYRHYSHFCNASRNNDRWRIGRQSLVSDISKLPR